MYAKWLCGYNLRWFKKCKIDVFCRFPFLLKKHVRPACNQDVKRKDNAKLKQYLCYFFKILYNLLTVIHTYSSSSLFIALPLKVKTWEPPAVQRFFTLSSLTHRHIPIQSGQRVCGRKAAHCMRRGKSQMWGRHRSSRAPPRW